MQAPSRQTPDSACASCPGQVCATSGFYVQIASSMYPAKGSRLTAATIHQAMAHTVKAARRLAH